MRRIIVLMVVLSTAMLLLVATGGEAFANHGNLPDGGGNPTACDAVGPEGNGGPDHDGAAARADDKANSHAPRIFEHCG